MNFKKVSRFVAFATILLLIPVMLATPVLALDSDESYTATVPVLLSAEAASFNITLPTSFPIAINYSTELSYGEAGADITNNSGGRIRVADIEVSANEDTGWHLGDYDNFDFNSAAIDSNVIGIMVTPSGGLNRVADGTPLKTSNGQPVQVLLSYDEYSGDIPEYADEWAIGATEGTNVLHVDFRVKATKVSRTITNVRVANIIITVAWDKL